LPLAPNGGEKEAKLGLNPSKVEVARREKEDKKQKDERMEFVIERQHKAEAKGNNKDPGELMQAKQERKQFRWIAAFGVQLPQDDGNTLWQDAMNKEPEQWTNGVNHNKENGRTKLTQQIVSWKRTMTTATQTQDDGNNTSIPTDATSLNRDILSTSNDPDGWISDADDEYTKDPGELMRTPQGDEHPKDHIGDNINRNPDGSWEDQTYIGVLTQMNAVHDKTTRKPIEGQTVVDEDEKQASPKCQTSIKRASSQRQERELNDDERKITVQFKT
jgi:hypothetical protein